MRSVGFSGYFGDEKSVVDIFEFKPLEQIKCCFGKCPVCDSSQFPEEGDSEIALEYPFIDNWVLLCKWVHISDFRMSSTDLNRTINEVNEVKQIRDNKSPVGLEFIAAYCWSLLITPHMALEGYISIDRVVPEEHEVNEENKSPVHQ